MLSLKNLRAYLARIFRQEKIELVSLAPDGYEPVNAFIAGIRYENRASSVLRCSLRERVWLRREPDNKYDANAIEVVTQQGSQLGHLSRHLAARLAPYMDEIGEPIPAVITGLTSNINGSEIAAKVGFYVPSEVFSDIESEREHIEYFCEVGSGGALYLLLDCDEAALKGVTNELTRAGLAWDRYGMSYRPAADGRQYRWYIVLEENVSEDEVDAFFRERFGVISQAKQAEEFEQAWIESEEESEMLMEEVARLKSELRDASDMENLLIEIEKENERLKKENHELRQTIKREQKERKQMRSCGDELQQVIRTLLPNIEFLKDSMDVIIYELRDNRHVLGKLHSIASGENPPQAKGVRSAPGWREIYYSTGQKQDGRLYFRCEKNRCWVLVSSKADQERDVKYLRAQW